MVPLGPVQGPQDDGDDRDHLREEVKGATRDGKVVIGKSSGYLTDASTAVAQLLSHLEKHLKIPQSRQLKSRKSCLLSKVFITGHICKIYTTNSESEYTKYFLFL